MKILWVILIVVVIILVVNGTRCILWKYDLQEMGVKGGYTTEKVVFAGVDYGGRLGCRIWYANTVNVFTGAMVDLPYFGFGPAQVVILVK